MSQTLERKTAENEMGETEYRDAWALVHFMLHGPADARAGLRGYLERSADQGCVVRHAALVASQAATGRSRRAMAEHFREWRRV